MSIRKSLSQYRQQNLEISRDLSEQLRAYYFPNHPGYSDDYAAIESWLYSGSIKSEQSRRTYRTCIIQLKEWLDRVGIESFLAVKLPDLQAYLYYRQQGDEQLNFKPLSVNAIAKHTSVIRSFWKFASKPSIGYLPLNLGEDLNIKWENKTATRYLPERKIIAIELFLESEQFSLEYRVIFALLYYSGARIGEIAKVTERDRINNKTQIVSPGLYWRDIFDMGTCLNITFQGKGNITRTVSLDGETSQLLREWREANGNPPDNSPVFPSKGRKSKGQPRTDRYVRYICSEISEALDIKFSPHWLRHSHATNAKRRGASDIDIRRQLGHTSTIMTERYTDMSVTEGTSKYLR